MMQSPVHAQGVNSGQTDPGPSGFCCYDGYSENTDPRGQCEGGWTEAACKGTDTTGAGGKLFNTFKQHCDFLCGAQYRGFYCNPEAFTETDITTGAQQSYPAYTCGNTVVKRRTVEDGDGNWQYFDPPTIGYGYKVKSDCDAICMPLIDVKTDVACACAVGANGTPLNRCSVTVKNMESSSGGRDARLMSIRVSVDTYPYMQWDMEDGKVYDPQHVEVPGAGTFTAREIPGNFVEWEFVPDGGSQAAITIPPQGTFETKVTMDAYDVPAPDPADPDAVPWIGVVYAEARVVGDNDSDSTNNLGEGALWPSDLCKEKTVESECEPEKQLVWHTYSIAIPRPPQGVTPSQVQITDQLSPCLSLRETGANSIEDGNWWSATPYQGAGCTYSPPPSTTGGGGGTNTITCYLPWDVSDPLTLVKFYTIVKPSGSSTSTCQPGQTVTNTATIQFLGSGNMPPAQQTNPTSVPIESCGSCDICKQCKTPNLRNCGQDSVEPGKTTCESGAYQKFCKWIDYQVPETNADGSTQYGRCAPDHNKYDDDAGVKRYRCDYSFSGCKPPTTILPDGTVIPDWKDYSGPEYAGYDVEPWRFVHGNQFSGYDRDDEFNEALACWDNRNFNGSVTDPGALSWCLGVNYWEKAVDFYGYDPVPAVNTLVETLRSNCETTTTSTTSSASSASSSSSSSAAVQDLWCDRRLPTVPANTTGLMTPLIPVAHAQAGQILCRLRGTVDDITLGTILFVPPFYDEVDGDIVGDPATGIPCGPYCPDLGNIGRCCRPPAPGIAPENQDLCPYPMTIEDCEEPGDATDGTGWRGIIVPFNNTASDLDCNTWSVAHACDGSQQAAGNNANQLFAE